MQKHRAWLVATAVLISSVAGCGSPGVVEVHRIKGSETAPEADGGAANSCPAGWSCMDLASLGFMATDADGNPVTASCGMGAAPMACDDADPAASCKGLTEPFCAHLKLGDQELVNCAQHCTP